MELVNILIVTMIGCLSLLKLVMLFLLLNTEDMDALLENEATSKITMNF